MSEPSFQALVLCPLPVLLDAHEVDDGSAAAHDGDVEDEGGRGGGGHQEQGEGGEGLQRPVDHVELHGDQVLVPPPLQAHVAQTLHPRVLVVSEPGTKTLIIRASNEDAHEGSYSQRSPLPPTARYYCFHI